MAKTIAVNADTRGFKKNIMDLSREIDKIGGKRSVQLFDKETQEFVSRGAKIAIRDMKNVMGELENVNKKISKEMKDQKLSQEDIRKKSLEQLRNKKQLLKLERDIAGVQGASGKIGMGSMGRFGKGFKGGSGGLLGKIPGMGTIAKGIGGAGLGMAGMAGGLLGGGLLGLGGLAIGQGIKGFNRFDANKQSRIGLMGRGMRGEEATGVFKPAQQLGINSSNLRDLQMQGMDIFGRGGSTREATTDRARAAKAMGIGAGEFQGAAAGLTQTMGVGGAQKSFAKLQAAMMGTEMKGAVGPWLSTMSSMLTNINEHGMGLDDAALSVLSDIGTMEGVGPEQTAKVFNGLNETMKGATGEKAAFFMSAMASQGIGQGSIGGAQFAMQQGLFGGNLDKGMAKFISPEDRAELSGAGLGFTNDEEGVEGFRKKMLGISTTFEKATKGMGAVGKGLVASRITGIQDPAAALAAMGMAKKGGTVQSVAEKEAIAKQMGEVMKSPQQQMISNLKTIADSNADILAVTQAFKLSSSEELGGQLVPIAERMNRALTNINTILSAVISIIPGMSTAKQMADERIKSGRITGKEIASQTPKRQEEIKKTLKKELAKSKARSQSLREYDDMMQGGRSGMNFHTKDIKKAEEKTSRIEELLGTIATTGEKQLKELAKPKTPGAKQGRGQGPK